MRQKLRKGFLAASRNGNKLTATAIGLMVAVVGYTLVALYAAPVFKTFEPENAAHTASITVVDDSTASDGRAIQFGAAMPENPTSPCLSAGSGGVLDDRLRQSFSSGGVTSQYHLYGDGLPADKPVGLLLHFHGDGAFEFKNPDSDFALPGIVDQAREHELLMLAVRTPDTSTETWWRNGQGNADWVRALMTEKVFEDYNIDRSRIWLVGYSGGSQFITKFFMPAHSDMMCGGGAVIFGGGGRPSSIPQPFTDSFKQNFNMHWYTGQGDTAENAEDGYGALTDSKRGFNFYQGRGFPATAQHPAGVNHNNIPFGQVVGEQFDKAYR